MKERSAWARVAGDLQQHGTASLIDRLRILIMLGRPRTCVPGLIAYGIGFSYTGAPFGYRFVLGAILSFFIGYSANVHNSYSDLAEDAENLPGRIDLIRQLGLWPLRYSLIALNVFMIAIAAFISGWVLAAMIGGAIGLIQYSFPPLRAKGHPIFGLLIFASAIGFPFLFGLGTHPELTVPAFHRTMVAPLFALEFPNAIEVMEVNRYCGMFVFLMVWFIAKGLFKNVPDYEGDLSAELVTSATVFRTRLLAAKAAALATIGAYCTLPLLVFFRMEQPRIVFALVWLPAVIWNCRRLLNAPDRSAANRVLAADMVVSSAFAGTLLLLIDPAPHNTALVAAGTAILVLSDLAALDSRRQQDVRVEDNKSAVG